MFCRIIFFFLIFTSLLFSQQFGKNKVQYTDKDWKYLQSKHFDIYFYQGGEKLAEFAAHIAESSYVSLSHTFAYDLVERIPIVIYRSQNEFTETNLTSGIVGESVGGFTEFLKDRMVLPFRGSYRDFRHVIHHELTHAVMLQYLYGTGPGSIVQGVSRSAPPLWFIEGLAEFESIGWNTESDMYARDATISGYLPPIPYLRAYLAYKGGQAVWRYIDEVYGDEKRTELIQRFRATREFKKAWKESMNESLETTSQKWQRWMQKQYWPEVKDRYRPFDYAQAITKHEEWGNFINNSPALSPQGDRIAFLSDRSGYFDIWVAPATQPEEMEKIINGQRQSNLEELNWLKPGMSWSPNGDRLAFAARARGEDAIHIYSFEQDEIVHMYKFGLDGLHAPKWSPTSDEIAFVGIDDGQSDIYVYNLQADSLRKVTDDIFSDMQPSWSPDGKVLAFASDRKANVEPPAMRDSISILDIDYQTTDIYRVQKNGAGLERLTENDFQDKSPTWAPDGQRLLFISDRTGIENVYVLDVETGKQEPITNLLTGTAQLEMAAKTNRLAFTAFAEGGYDVYLWIDPFSEINPPAKPEKTEFITRASQSRLLSKDLKQQSPRQLAGMIRGQQDFDNFVFDSDFRRGNIGVSTERTKDIELSREKQYEDGELVKTPYKPDFSIDYISANAGYSNFFGVSGLTSLYVSDVLGNHNFRLGLNIIRNLENSDGVLAYQNKKYRTNFGGQAYQFVNFYGSTQGIVRFANRGANANVSYPFSRYRRVELGVSYMNILMDNLRFPQIPETRMNLLVPSLSLTHDNSLWAFYSPGNGSRRFLQVQVSPDLGDNGRQFVTGQLDLRHYLSLGRDYTLALRLSGGASFGQDPTPFILGGMRNWFNRRFAQDLNYLGIEDFFLANFMTPLRGAALYEMVGTRSALFNMEFRFPFIQQMVTRFPFRAGFRNIRGIGFLDVGTAWTDSDKWRFTDTAPDGDRYVSDLFTGFGWGIRANVYIFLLRLDAAWATDFKGISKPRYYWTLGYDF